MPRDRSRRTLLVSSLAAAATLWLALTGPLPTADAQQPPEPAPADDTPAPTGEPAPSDDEAPTGETPPGDEAPAADTPPAEGDTATEQPAAQDAVALVASALADDLLRLDLPPNARLTPILDDERGSAWRVEVPGGPAVEIMVVDLEALGVDMTNEKAVNSKISQISWGYLGVEKTVGLTAKGRADLKLNGCKALVHTYADDDHQVRLAVCAHPTGRRLYLFRTDLWPDVKADHDRLTSAFDGFLVESVGLLTPPPSPAPTEGTPTEPTEPTEPPTSPTTPAPTTP